jgi:putative transposase
MEPSEAKRLKVFEDENAKLKRLLAEAMLDNTALKDLLSKMYGPPRCCKVFVGDAPACVDVSGL